MRLLAKKLGQQMLSILFIARLIRWHLLLAVRIMPIGLNLLMPLSGLNGKVGSVFNLHANCRPDLNDWHTDSCLEITRLRSILIAIFNDPSDTIRVLHLIDVGLRGVSKENKS